MAVQETESAPSFLTGGGALGALIRAYDWSKTPLGPAANWPSTLKTAVSLMLGARQPFSMEALANRIRDLIGA